MGSMVEATPSPYAGREDLLSSGSGQARLTHQWGVEPPAGSTASPLVYPFGAHLTDFGTCLIVDRGAGVNRLVEVDRDGRVVWEYAAAPRMNFAHRINVSTVLVLQGDGFWAVRQDGSRERLFTFPVTGHLNCGSINGDRIAVGTDEGIFLLSVDGRLINHLAPSPDRFIEPMDLELLDSGHILVTDACGTCAVELDRSGHRVATFGVWRHAMPDRDRVAVPGSSCRLADGRTVVADWRRGRLSVYGTDRRLQGVLPASRDAELFAPSFVRETPSGNLIVSESGGRRVMVRNLDGDVLWSYGAPGPTRTSLHFPRIAEPMPDGGLLVADCYADRVVAIGADGLERWEVGPQGAGLTFPRSASASRGVVAIADGINRRVVLVGSDGAVRSEITEVRSRGKRVALGDPHWVESIDDQGTYLLVDADLRRVMVIDDSGSVLSQWGADQSLLDDPHHAMLLRDGDLLVADTGNSRLVRLDPQGLVVWESTSYRVPGGEPVAWRCPRTVRMLPDRTMAVVDTSACQVLVVDSAGLVRWQVGPALDISAFPAAAPQLRTPKWAAYDGAGGLVVTDYYNGRVVTVGIPPGQQAQGPPFVVPDDPRWE